MDRRASHAGSWYSNNAVELGNELDTWLEGCGLFKQSSARAVIAPHAGYSYSGRCAAYAFANIDPDRISRVFLLGPSHHYFTRKCALSRASVYRTPLGDLSIDLDIYSELKRTGKFEEMTISVDEAEHSMEMHLPYLAKIFKGRSVKIVPILVGALSSENEGAYGKLLAKYLDDPANFFSVSSDFCHWGLRFDYIRYDEKQGPIYKYIEALDHSGMQAIESGNPEAFKEYLSECKNTICGRHPIAVFMHMKKNCETLVKIKFLQYEQSNQCMSKRESSVSYASAVATVDE